MSNSHGTSHDHDHSHGSVRTYMLVFLGLIVLTAISFWLGNSSLKETMPASAWAGMMAVSSGKALLVILFFMHLKWEANWKYVLTIPAMMMSVFLVCMLIPDVGLRLKRYSEERIVRAAQARAIADQGEKTHEHDAAGGHADPAASH